VADYTVIRCSGVRDLPNCPTGAAIHTAAMSGSQQRRIAVVCGWGLDGARFLCPRCAGGEADRLMAGGR